MSARTAFNALANSESKGLTRMVLMVLAMRVNEGRGDFLSWPSAGSLARDCNASRSSVSEALAKLRELGDIIDTGKLENRATVYLIEAARSVPVADTTESVPVEDITSDPDRSVPSQDSVVSPLRTDSVPSQDTNSNEQEEEQEPKQVGTADAAPKLDLVMPEATEKFSPPENDEFAKFYPACDFDAPRDVMEAAKYYNMMVAAIRDKHPDAPRFPVRCGKMTADLSKALMKTVNACGGVADWHAQLRKITRHGHYSGRQHLTGEYKNWRLTLSFLTEKRRGKPTINQFIEAEEDVPETAEDHAVATGEIDPQTARILKRRGGRSQGAG